MTSHSEEEDEEERSAVRADDQARHTSVHASTKIHKKIKRSSLSQTLSASTTLHRISRDLDFAGLRLLLIRSERAIVYNEESRGRHMPRVVVLSVIATSGKSYVGRQPGPVFSTHTHVVGG
ncbi:hypothetical protein MTO96_048486 [Rhipicephalus appendiculatus]